jgi:polyphenol oxidase
MPRASATMAEGLLRADWPAPAGIRALTTRRDAEGVSQPPFDRCNLGHANDPDGDDPAAVEANRERLLAVAGLPSRPHWLRQVHGTAVCRFERPPLYALDGGRDVIREAPPQADAAVTATPGVVLAILSADCLPVLLCADDGSEVAAAHAGWRGLAAGVLEATVAAMHVPPARLLAWFGPAAGPAAYEVGDEVRAAFLDSALHGAADPDTAAAFVPSRPGHWHCDLFRLARRSLQRLGLTAIHGGGECTISHRERWFSHRRDGRSGRMASLVWIEPSVRPL